MNPTDIILNGVLSALFAYLKAQGMAAEEAKTALAAKVAQIEALPPLPMDI